jgi:Htaa
MRRRLGRRGLVVLAVVGVALASAVPAGAKVRSVAGNGVVKVGEVPCGAAPCTLRAPSRVRITIGGQAFRAKVAVPRRVAAHAVATVRVKLGAQALKKLAGTIAEVKVRVIVRAAGTKEVSVAQARISRPASPEGGSGGSTPTAPGGTPASNPIEGEPPLLARPATAVTVSGVSLSWMPRDSWVRYVSSGIAANDGVVPGAGATGVASTSSPCSDRPSESSASLNYTINFPAKESWYDPLSGVAGFYGSGNVAYRYTSHSINLTAAEPEIEINGSASRAIFRFNGSGGTPYPNQRVALETLETAGRPTLSNGGKTLTYNLMRGRLTENGEKVFAGFYTAPGDNEFGCVSASFTLP